MAEPHSNNTADTEQPFLSHLLELRNRLLYAVLSVLVIFLALFSFSHELYHLVAEPLIRQMPEGTSMISTKPAGTFFTPMKLALMMSIFVAAPFILYQAWAFVAPGLYSHERRFAIPLLVSSVVLFYGGIAFAYYFLLPLMFKFLIAVTPEGVQMMTDIGEYLDFVLGIFLAFGVAFQVPVVVILLCWVGVVSPEQLAGARRYVIVGAFVIAAIITPPDVISQFSLAVPMALLYEAGLFVARYLVKARNSQSDETAEAEEDMDTTLDRYIRDEQALNSEMQSWHATDDKDQPKDK